MNDQFNESISALVDGEADDLELRRLLNQLKHAAPEESQALRGRWASYHRMGAALRGEAGAVPVDEGFSASVAAAIAQLDNDPLEAGQSAAVAGASPAVDAAAEAAVLAPVPAWKRFAVAASVTLAVLVGYQQLTPDLAGTEPAIAIAEPPIGSTAGAVDPAAIAAVADTASPEQAALAQQRLNEYLLRHTSHAAQQSGQGMIPFARLANFEEE